MSISERETITSARLLKTALPALAEDGNLTGSIDGARANLLLVWRIEKNIPYARNDIDLGVSVIGIDHTRHISHSIDYLYNISNDLPQIIIAGRIADLVDLTGSTRRISPISRKECTAQRGIGQIT